MSTLIADIHVIYKPIEEPLKAAQVVFDQELHSDLPFVESLCAHVRQYRGKMLRPALHLLSGQSIAPLTEDHIRTAAVMEMVHVATLVHDDILDEADSRRQAQTLNRMTGNETAVLVGDYLISHAYHLCSSLQSNEVSRIVAACTNRVCEGELQQVYHRENWNLSKEIYLDIISRKTAALTAAACQLGALLSGGTDPQLDAMHDFGLNAGIAFQIVDDVLDLSGREESLGKPLFQDVKKGKVTLPLITYLGRHPEQGQQTIDDALVALNAGDATVLPALLREDIDSALQVAQHHVERALAALDTLPPSASRVSLMNLAEMILSRSV